MTQTTVSRLVRTYQNALRLDEWEVALECVPLPQLGTDDKLGRIWPQFETMTATLEVATARPDEAVRSTILHEMLHLAVADVCRVVSLAKDELGPGTWNVLKESYEVAEERLVVRLTRAFGESV